MNAPGSQMVGPAGASGGSKRDTTMMTSRSWLLVDEPDELIDVGPGTDRVVARIECGRAQSGSSRVGRCRPKVDP